MKVLAIVILAVASIIGNGYAAYLPSGWRPQGPAFLLPSEVKSSENLKDVILADSEASGSDFLREYGPPKVHEISQNLINQGLPDAVTEQSFEIVPLAVEIKEAEEVVQNVEDKTEQALERSEATTESAVKGDVTFDLPIVVVESNVESTQVSLTNNEEASKANVELSQFAKVISSENLEQSSQKTEVNSDKSSARLAQVSRQQAQNIPDIIASLENENKAQPAAKAVDGIAVQAGAAFPEGFLEYGPPGFTEYGPPKEKSAEPSFEYTNEIRRRRFSPNFK
ncbi:unnamed protein product [Euphydryas editha]|uniref:Uncharacterized protein n=1 Tax=Euphydryas editha TaxID=104508 RepID=A0AAU9UH37_EUPED|nr:unnamed protein product [Euphydryas editha]